MADLTPAFKAAAAVLTDRHLPQQGRKGLSVRNAAVQFKTSSSAVQRAISSLLKPDLRPPRWPGRPRSLTKEDDEALVAYVMLLQRGGFPATKSQLVNAANSLRRRRDPDIADLGRNWYARWRRDHPTLQGSYNMKEAGPAGQPREASNVNSLIAFFDNLKNIIQTHNIDASECWSEDECGIRLGCLRGSVQLAVVRTTRSQRPQTLGHSNGESSSLIGSVNAAGESIRPWLISRTFPTEDWSEIRADDAIYFARSETGFPDSQLSFRWLHDFNLCSWEKSERAKLSGLGFDEWFGCDEWLRDPENPGAPPYELPPVKRPEEEKIYRLLVIGKSTGHTSLEFIEYCIKFDIILVAFPSHLTHIPQPLDVGVFQPMKKAHQKPSQKPVAHTNLALSQLEFLTTFQKMYDEGFTKQNIISGFKKTGIFPPDARPAVVRTFAQPHSRQQTLNPAYSFLLSKESGFYQVSASETNGDVTSSPTREGLRQAGMVATEACALQKDVSSFSGDRIRRINKLSKRRMRTGWPPGEEHRVIKVEMERLRKRWQYDSTLRQATGQERMTFEAWVDYTYTKKSEFPAPKIRNTTNHADPCGRNDATALRSHCVEKITERASEMPLILDQTSEYSWGAGSNSNMDVTTGPFGNQDDDNGDVAQTEGMGTERRELQETSFDVAGDRSDDDEFLSLPPASPTLPKLETLSNTEERPYTIMDTIKEFLRTRPW